MSGAATALLLGTRNTLYGLRMAPVLQWHGWRRVAAAHVLIDESTAMSVNRPTTPGARLGFLTTGLSVFVLWNMATAIGAIAGEAVGDVRQPEAGRQVGRSSGSRLVPGDDGELVAQVRELRRPAAAVLGRAVDEDQGRSRAVTPVGDGEGARLDTLHLPNVRAGRACLKAVDLSAGRSCRAR